MPTRHQPRTPLIRVVRNSADSSSDYYLPRTTAEELGLGFVSVYANERTAYDPTGRYVHLRITRHPHDTSR